MLDSLILRFRDKMDCRLVLIFFEVPVNTVVARIELAADKPFPAGRIAGIQHCMPALIPVQQVGVLLETLREIIQAEPFIDALVCHICLGDEFP